VLTVRWGYSAVDEATVNAVDIARRFREGADGAQDQRVFQRMLTAAAAARTAEARERDRRRSRSSPIPPSRHAR
jgi:hypothetical protein